MKGPATRSGRRGIHLVTGEPLVTAKECVAKSGHDALGTLNVGHLRRLRIEGWGWLARLTEARWLEAYGWHRLGKGWWGLPEGHPKKGLGPYDQNHAANSQRALNRKGNVVKPITTFEMPFNPVAARYLPRQMIAYSVQFSSVSWAVHQDWESPWAWVPLTIALVSFLYTIYLARGLKRDITFEEAERVLRSSNGSRFTGTDTHRNRRR